MHLSSFDIRSGVLMESRTIDVDIHDLARVLHIRPDELRNEPFPVQWAEADALKGGFGILADPSSAYVFLSCEPPPFRLD